jgi:GTPase
VFKRQGLYNALRRVNAREGDSVDIGGLRFEYFEENEGR